MTDEIATDAPAAPLEPDPTEPAAPEPPEPETMPEGEGSTPPDPPPDGDPSGPTLESLVAEQEAAIEELTGYVEDYKKRVRELEDELHRAHALIVKQRMAAEKAAPEKPAKGRSILERIANPFVGE